VRSLLAPRYWGAHLLMVLALAASGALGVWQYHAWTAGRAAEARDLSQAAPLPLDRVMGGDDPFPGEHLGRPVSFAGEWLGGGTLYVADRQLDGRRGFWVVTPVLVEDSAMPVVRGWAAEPDAPVPSGPVEVEGWLQASEGSSRPDDDPGDDVIPEMRIASVVEHVDADLYGAYVVADQPTGASDGLEAVPPESVPDVSGTTHLRNLLYAFQWWIFGGFAIYIWVRWCRDTSAQPAAPERVASDA
jgi:cytochrome oxidase assembly protein ShyY1